MVTQNNILFLSALILFSSSLSAMEKKGDRAGDKGNGPFMDQILAEQKAKVLLERVALLNRFRELERGIGLRSDDYKITKLQNHLDRLMLTSRESFFDCLFPDLSIDSWVSKLVLCGVTNTQIHPLFFQFIYFFISIEGGDFSRYDKDQAAETYNLLYRVSETA
jgi:hypothetical protein